ncbi:hypothetical protein [Erythrobacter sp. YT30]|uniref:hypothetical protein n=1 Tax=Erythrobacter sp. YT30 TaxID=1735012 RepID=UPI0012E3469F|nr:hypothetical protein [Erythrobacter sp. YT30]
MRWQTHFDFDQAQLNVEWAFEHIDRMGKVWRHHHDGDGLEPVSLRRLCQQKVSMISVEPLTLTIGFGDGDVLKVFTEVGMYECGHIFDADGKITVF